MRGDEDAKNDKTLSSSEFERFLAERTAAAAAEASGGASAGAAAASGNSNSGATTRQIDKDKEDKSLFAL